MRLRTISQINKPTMYQRIVFATIFLLNSIENHFRINEVEQVFTIKQCCVPTTIFKQERKGISSKISVVYISETIHYIFAVIINGVWVEAVLKQQPDDLQKSGAAHLRANSSFYRMCSFVPISPIPFGLLIKTIAEVLQSGFSYILGRIVSRLELFF